MCSWRQRSVWLGLAMLPPVLCGCAGLQEYLPTANCGAAERPVVEIAETDGAAAVGVVTGVDDARWLEIARSERDGVVGGYLSTEPSPRGSLVLLLSGAGTNFEQARVASVLNFFREYGGRYRDAGFRVWAPVLSEAAPYGTTEVEDVVDLLEWLNGPRAMLQDVKRVFLVGYSTGATTANFVNLRASATAVVSIAGLTEPDQLVRFAELYRGVTDLFPCNTGMLQLRHTLNYYGAAGWDEFDIVARTAELRNPTLFMTAEDDIIYASTNVRHIEAAYRQVLAAGASMPILAFEYLPRGGHFVYVDEPEPFERVLRYLEQFD